MSKIVKRVKNNVEYFEVIATQSNILSKLMYMIYMFDYSSIYLAIKNKVDPSPVSSIDFIKSRI